MYNKKAIRIAINSMMPIPDYYAILQIDPYTPPDGIRAAYRHLELTAPLVKNSSTPYRLAWIREAYFVLSDPARRAHYDFARLEHQLEPGEQIDSLEELYQYPSTFVSQQLTKRNKHILYGLMMVISPVFVWALITWRLDIVIFLIFGGLVVSILGTALVNVRQPVRIRDIDED
jgi:hypothetical protein